MDDVEFGGKKWIKEEVSGTLADYIIQHHKTVSGLNRVIIRILEQINKDLAKLDEIERLEKIYRAAENRAVDAALAVERAKRAAEPAIKRAVLRRELDREGDRDEERAVKDKERRDAAKRARIEVVPEDRGRRPRARKNIPTIRMRGKRSRRTSRRIDHRRRGAAHRRRSHRSQRRVEQVVRTGLAIRFGLGGMGRMGRIGRRHHRGHRLHRGRGETFNQSHRRRSKMGRRGEY
jgi:hypothetical protein